MIKKCLLPVAGFGTRFLPVTKTVPKELLPILSKPLIEYSLEEAIESNIREIVLVTNKFKTGIKQHFEPHSALENLILGTNKDSLLNSTRNIMNNCELNYVYQEKMLGLGHAILQGRELIGNEPFAVILPDDLCYTSELSVIGQMMKIFESHQDKCVVAIEEVSLNEVENYGVIDGDEEGDSGNLFNVNIMVEKPKPSNAPSNLAIIGRYIFTRDIFEAIEKVKPDLKGEIQITDALMYLAQEGKVLAYKFAGKRMDCGSVDGYLEANNFFYGLS